MIKTHYTLQRGLFHDHYCEDFYIVEPIATHRQLLAVMDGCSMGKESTFASMLVGKLLRQIAKEAYYQDFLTPSDNTLDQQLKTILKQLFEALKSMKNRLGLDQCELLCTLNICLMDTEVFAAECLVLGDGLVCHDGQLHDFDQQDRPDYPAYHLGEDFEAWYIAQKQRLTINSFEDLSICTDGLFTFQSQKKNGLTKSANEIIDFLIRDRNYCEQSHFLDRKIRFMTNDWQHQVMDDLALIRVIKQES